MINWPNGKNFAFTIVDDTDCSTLDNAPIIYDYLYDKGYRTTKSVWMFDGEVRKDNRRIIGTTCQDQKYLKWVLSLKEKDFEIALHSASWSRSKRERVIEALNLFKEIFGKDPSILVQHNDTMKCESIYWGENRISGIYKFIYKILMLTKGRIRNIYTGDNVNSDYFWGDICKERIKYVRNFIFAELNTLKACPMMPYFDCMRPYVNCWFSSSEAPDVNSFNKILSISNQEKLETERGACIIYTHLGKGFCKNGHLNKDFTFLMDGLSKRNGWYVPASEILNQLSKTNGIKKINNMERKILEKEWLFHKLKIGGTS